MLTFCLDENSCGYGFLITCCCTCVFTAKTDRRWVRHTHFQNKILSIPFWNPGRKCRRAPNTQFFVWTHALGLLCGQRKCEVACCRKKEIKNEGKCRQFIPLFLHLCSKQIKHVVLRDSHFFAVNDMIELAHWDSDLLASALARVLARFSPSVRC